MDIFDIKNYAIKKGFRVCLQSFESINSNNLKFLDGYLLIQNQKKVISLNCNKGNTKNNYTIALAMAYYQNNKDNIKDNSIIMISNDCMENIYQDAAINILVTEDEFNKAAIKCNNDAFVMSKYFNLPESIVNRKLYYALCNDKLPSKEKMKKQFKIVKNQIDKF